MNIKHLKILTIKQMIKIKLEKKKKLNLKIKNKLNLKNKNKRNTTFDKYLSNYFIKSFLKPSKKRIKIKSSLESVNSRKIEYKTFFSKILSQKKNKGNISFLNNKTNTSSSNYKINTSFLKYKYYKNLAKECQNKTPSQEKRTRKYLDEMKSIRNTKNFYFRQMKREYKEKKKKVLVMPRKLCRILTYRNLKNKFMGLVNLKKLPLRSQKIIKKLKKKLKIVKKIEKTKNLKTIKKINKIKELKNTKNKKINKYKLNSKKWVPRVRRYFEKIEEEKEDSFISKNKIDFNKKYFNKKGFSKKKNFFFPFISKKKIDFTRKKI